MKKAFKIASVFIWITIIFSFSLQPGDTSGNVSNTTLDIILNIFTDVEVFKGNNYNTYYFLGTVIRKLAHLTEYCILGILISNLFRNIQYTVMLGVIVAIIDEGIQLFVEGRAGLFTDVLIDTTGIILGIFLFRFIYKKVVEK